MAQMRPPNQIYGPQLSAVGNMAEQENEAYKKFANPIQKKIMWPTIALSMLTDPSISPAITKGLGKLSPTVGKMAEGVAPALGPMGAAAYLLPKVLSEGSKAHRHGAERRNPQRIGGVVGAGSTTLDMASSIDFLTRLPGWSASLAGLGPDLLKRSPRIANWLTGTGGQVLAGKGSAAAGGGILNTAYSGLKSGADALSGGNISAALASGAKKGGLAGVASSGAGLVDKGLSGLLASPTGVMLGMAGLQVGLAIYKSVKMAKLMPQRQSPDKFSRKFYNASQAIATLNKINAMGSTGKIDPNTMTYMVQQGMLYEMIKLNMQIAGLRGEYHTENLYIREEKDKGSSKFDSSYGSEIYGDDNRGLIMRFLDWADAKVNTAKAKYDPFTQLVGMLRGRMPGDTTSLISKTYGYDDESKSLKEKAEQFGVSLSHMRLLHTSSRSILDMAPTYEAKVLAILSATYDLQRYGYAKEYDIKEQAPTPIRDALSKLNPLNLPGINALKNIVVGAGKFVGKTLPSIPNKIFDMGKKAAKGSRDYLLGEKYNKLKDTTELNKAAGLHKPPEEKAFDYISEGLPNQVERIRSVLFDIYYIQEEMLQHAGGRLTKRKDELKIWNVIDKLHLTQKSDKASEDSQKDLLNATKEKAFREGPLGKIMYLKAVLDTKVGRGMFKHIEDEGTIEAGIKRQKKAESKLNKLEIGLTGDPETFDTDLTTLLALSQNSSLKTDKSMKFASMKELESERELEKGPTSAAWKMGAGVVGAASILAPLLLGPMGLFGSAAAIVAYGKKRLSREKDIIDKRDADIFSRDSQERGLETASEYYSTDHELRASERGTLTEDLTGKGRAASGLIKVDPATAIKDAAYSLKRDLATNISEITKRQDEQLEQLKLIAGYLGVSDKENIYSLLAEGSPYAEVTVVDKEGRSVFIGGGPSPISQVQFVDGVGGTMPNGIETEKILEEISANNVNIPSNYKNSPQGLAWNARAEGGPVDKDKPVLVGEEGPEILMPKSAGVIIPNDQIEKFNNGGISGSTDKFDIFGKMYQSLKELVKMDKEALAIDIHQEKKAEKDDQTLEMHEKLDGLKVREEKKKESIWKQDVVKLLSGILKKPISDTKGKIKEAGTGIWDFLKNIWKSLNWKEILGGLLAGLGIAGLAAGINELINNTKPLIERLKKLNEWLTNHGMSGLEQSKLAGRGIIGAGAVAGAMGKTLTPEELVAKTAAKTTEAAKVKEAAKAKEAAKVKEAADALKTTKEAELAKISEEVKAAEASKASNKATTGYQMKSASQMDDAARARATTSAKAAEYKATTGYKIPGVDKAAEVASKESMLAKIGAAAKTGLTSLKGITPMFESITKAVEPVIVGATKVFSFLGKSFGMILAPLKGIATVVGRFMLPLQMVLTAFDFVSDAMTGYKEGGIGGAIQGFLIGPMKDDMETTLGQVGKYFGAGMLLGVAGGPMGMLVGGLVGAAVGATISAFKSTFMSFKTEGLWGGIKQLFLGDKEGGLLSAIKTAGPYALAGAVAGIPFGGPIGSLVGGLIGAAIGGIIGWFGQFAIVNTASNFVDMMSEWGPNKFIIESLFMGEGLKYGQMFAEYGSVIPIVGTLVGGIVGSVVDASILLFSGASNVFSKVAEWCATADEYIIAKQDKGSYAASFARKGSGVATIFGTVIGSLLGSLVDVAVGIGGWAGKKLASIFGINLDEANATSSAAVGGRALTEKEVAQNKEMMGEGQPKGTWSYSGPGDPGTFTPDSQSSLAKQHADKKAATLASQKKELEDNALKVETAEYDKFMLERAKASPEDQVKLDQQYRAAKEERSKKSGVKLSEKPTTPGAVAGKNPPTSITTASQTGSSPSGEAQASSVPTGAPQFKGSVNDLLKKAASKTGTPFELLQKIVNIESSGNPKADNGTAAGLFGFTKKTWARTVEKFGTKFDISQDKAAPEYRFDPWSNAIMGAALVSTYDDRLKAMGINDINDADRYSVHMTGNALLAKNARVNPQMNIQDFIRSIYKDPKLADQAIRGNPVFQKGTVGSAYASYVSKMNVPTSKLAKLGQEIKGGASSALSGIKEAAGALYDKAPQKAKDIMGILGGAFTEVSDAFQEAFMSAFTDEGLKKKEETTLINEANKTGAADVAGLRATEAANNGGVPKDDLAATSAPKAAPVTAAETTLVSQGVIEPNILQRKELISTYEKLKNDPEKLARFKNAVYVKYPNSIEVKKIFGESGTVTQGETRGTAASNLTVTGSRTTDVNSLTSLMSGGPANTERDKMFSAFGDMVKDPSQIGKKFGGPMAVGENLLGKITGLGKSASKGLGDLGKQADEYLGKKFDSPEKAIASIKGFAADEKVLKARAEEAITGGGEVSDKLLKEGRNATSPEVMKSIAEAGRNFMTGGKQSNASVSPPPIPMTVERGGKSGTLINGGGSIDRTIDRIFETLHESLATMTTKNVFGSGIAHMT